MTPKATDALDALRNAIARAKTSGFHLAHEEIAEVCEAADEYIAALTAAPQDVTQRHYKCGCVSCICADEEKCHGCGAKSCQYPKEGVDQPTCSRKRITHWHEPDAAPPGFVLVPREPTEEMYENVIKEVDKSEYGYLLSKGYVDQDDCNRIYKALLAAAPSPPQIFPVQDAKNDPQDTQGNEGYSITRTVADIPNRECKSLDGGQASPPHEDEIDGLGNAVEKYRAGVSLTSSEQDALGEAARRYAAQRK